MAKFKSAILILIIVSAIIGIALFTTIVIWLCKNNTRESYTNLDTVDTPTKYQMLEDLYLTFLCHKIVKHGLNPKNTEDYLINNFKSKTNLKVLENFMNKYELVDHIRYGSAFYNKSENKLLFIFRGCVPNDVRMLNIYSLFLKKKSLYKDDINLWAYNIIKKYSNPTVDTVGYSFGGPRAIEIFQINSKGNYIPGEIRVYSSTMGSRFINKNISSLDIHNKPKRFYHVVDRRDILAYVGKPGSEIKLDIFKTYNPFDTLHYHHTREIYNSIYNSIPKDERKDGYFKSINNLENIIDIINI